MKGDTLAGSWLNKFWQDEEKRDYSVKKITSDVGHYMNHILMTSTCGSQSCYDTSNMSVYNSLGKSVEYLQMTVYSPFKVLEWSWNNAPKISKKHRKKNRRRVRKL